MKIQCLLVDDNAVYRASMANMLQMIPDLHLMGSCSDAFAAREILLQSGADLVFLDIEMPGLTGIELIKSLPQPPLFVFITSHPHFAIDGFELDAVDFLVKPVGFDRILRAINKARQLLQLKQEAGNSEQFRVQDNQSFFVKEKQDFIRVQCADVQYIESLGDFVNIYLAGGKKILALVSLKNLELQLPAEYFLRISRTHMVHRAKITAINNTHVMMDKLHFSIGKTYVARVTEEVLGNKAIKRYLD
jgi:two-component system, LytTR family, response regulator